MNTLPHDLLCLIENHCSSYETILLGFQLNSENFYMKWFLHNYKNITLARASTLRFDNCHYDGPDVLKLVEQKGLKFLEYLIDNKYLYGRFACQRFTTELFKLAIKIGLDKNRLNILASFDFYNFLDLDYELCMGRLRYNDIYNPRNFYKYDHALWYASKNTVEQIIKDIRLDRNAYSSTNKDDQLRCYEYIVCQEYKKLSKLLKESKNVYADDLVKLACRRNDAEALEIILYRTNYDESYIRRYGHNKDVRELIIPECPETTEVIAVWLEYKYLVKYCFQNGYDGPAWQSIVEEQPELLTSIYLHDIEKQEDGFFRLKTNMIKTLFEHNKPSSRELHYLKHKARIYRLYDLYMYLCELETSLSTSY